MARDKEDRVLINTDIQQNIAKSFQPGMRVVLFEGEMEVLEVEALLEFDAEYNRW
jgi:hypothetical protein